MAEFLRIARFTLLCKDFIANASSMPNEIARLSKAKNHKTIRKNNTHTLQRHIQLISKKFHTCHLHCFAKTMAVANQYSVHANY